MHNIPLVELLTCVAFTNLDCSGLHVKSHNCFAKLLMHEGHLLRKFAARTMLLSSVLSCATSQQVLISGPISKKWGHHFSRIFRPSDSKGFAVPLYGQFWNFPADWWHSPYQTQWGVPCCVDLLSDAVCTWKDKSMFDVQTKMYCNICNYHVLHLTPCGVIFR